MREMLSQGDVNAVGELLRSVTFVGEGYGCYSTFDVRPGAQEWPAEKVMRFWQWMFSDSDGTFDPHVQEDLEMLAGSMSGHTFTIGGFTVDVAWLWDGDGDLYIQLSDDTGPIRALRNTDCKKPCYWQPADPIPDGII